MTAAGDIGVMRVWYFQPPRPLVLTDISVIYDSYRDPSLSLRMTSGRRGLPKSGHRSGGRGKPATRFLILKKRRLLFQKAPLLSFLATVPSYCFSKGSSSGFLLFRISSSVFIGHMEPHMVQVNSSSGLLLSLYRFALAGSMAGAGGTRVSPAPIWPKGML